MKVIFRIEYDTRWGENLCVVLDGAEAERLKLDPVLGMRYADGEWQLMIDLPAGAAFEYRYRVVSDKGETLREEWGEPHRFAAARSLRECVRIDRWADRPAESSFYSSAFTEGIFARGKRSAAVPAAGGTLLFEVEAPEVKPDEVLALAGEPAELGGWDPERALVMSDARFPVWSVSVKAAKLAPGFAYKFIVRKAATGRVVDWEAGANRYWNCRLPETGACVALTGDRFRSAAAPWRGAGVAIPVFSLRSEESFGVGEFYDLKKMVDWARATGLKVIQILPINDTTMTGTWQDSYPYNANSTYALHPQFLRLEAVGRLSDKRAMAKYRKLGKELNALPEVDYERVNTAKASYLKELFAEQGAATLASEEFIEFFRRNETWLRPYAAFCTLRDRHRTADFSRWGKWATYDSKAVGKLTSPGSDSYAEVAQVYFVQYHLDRQLREVRNYAHAHGVVLKGDIPIGISRTSCDAWVDPDLFHMDSQAGAPPDDFSVLGQNWGLPTYNWERMAEDGYAWWKARFRKMAEYFDAYRIDHILGFFRIWEIPYECVHGLLGHFNPALPFSEEEIRGAGLWFNAARHAEPYIYHYMLDDFFGEAAEEVRTKYLQEAGCGRYTLREEVDTQRKIERLFAGKSDDRSHRICDGLMGLVDEVLFVEDPVKRGLYHPRISAQFTYSYRALGDGERAAFDRLYNDFFYYRHNEYWRSEAMRKLPPLLSATRMLVCGEDLGMIPHCVPQVMNDLQILSLEVQRMPKDPNSEFGNTWGYPYRSVSTTSTHDMSPLRAWWEEDRVTTQRFYNTVLHEPGEAPLYCEPWVAGRIVDLHLASPSMLVILPLQDWLAEDGELRREVPQEERINVPSIPRYYWRYRMHLTLEQLLGEQDFNTRMRTRIEASGR